MVVAGAEQRICACYKEQEEFHKILDLKDAGLVVYCHSLCREGQVSQGGVVGSAISTSQDICLILQNTKDVKLTPADILPTLEKKDISCPRCRKLFEHAQKVLQIVTSVDKKNTMGVCDHCLKKAQSKKPCDLCSETVKKFLTLRDEKKEEMQRYLKLWLSKMRHIVKDAVTEKTKKSKPRAHSDLQINRICQASPKRFRQPEVQQMYELRKSDSDLFADEVGLEKKEQKSVNFNEAVDPFAVTPFERGSVDTFGQGPSLVESDLAFYGSEHDLQDSILRSKIQSQKQIIHEIPKIAPWEQESQEKKDDSSIVKEVTLKLKRDPSSRGMSPHDSSGPSDKGTSSIYMKVMPRKRHMPESDHRGLGEPKRKKHMESTTDIKGAKRKPVAGEFEHPYSEQYKNEKEEYSKKAHDTKGLPKTLTRLEDGHLTDDEVKLQHKIPKLSHEAKEIGKRLESKSSIRRKKPKRDEATVEHILQKQFSYFFPKSMEKQAKKPPKIGAPSSQLIRATHEKIRQQAEEEKKRHEQERQRKLEEKEKKRLEKEERKRLEEERKKEEQLQKKQSDLEKRLADEEKRKRAAEEELIKKSMSEDEKRKSEDRGRKESLKKDLASKYDQKEEKVDESKKNLKQKVDAKGKAVKDQEKDFKTKPELKAKAATKDRIEETGKTKPTGTKDKVEEPDKIKNDLQAKPELKGKPDKKDKVEEIDKTEKDKSKPEPKVKPTIKDKVEETDKPIKDKTKPEPTAKPGSKEKETEKSKTEAKVKPESKGKTDIKDEDKEKAKKDAKVKPERVDETESAKRDKAKKDAKVKPERVDETESAKIGKAKAEPRVKTDLKEKTQETESTKSDKVKSGQKDKTEKVVQEKDSKSKSAINDKDEAKLQREKDKQDRDEQRKKDREEKEKQDRDEQRKQEREEKEKSKLDRDEKAKKDREEKEKSKLDRDEQAKKDREEKGKSKQDREEQAKKDREEKSKELKKDKDAISKIIQESKAELETSEKRAKEGKSKEKEMDFKGMKVDKGELSEPAIKTKTISGKSADLKQEDKSKEKQSKSQDKSPKVVEESKEKTSKAQIKSPKVGEESKEKPSKAQEKSPKVGEESKEKPSKAQEKSPKVGEESKEKSKGKEKPLDFKGMKIDKGELSEPAIITKSISGKSADLQKEDKSKEKLSKSQDKSPKVGEEAKEKTSKAQIKSPKVDEESKEKPSKAQEKSPKVGEESKEKSKGKEKPLDFKGMKLDKGELLEPALITKAIAGKPPDMAKVKDSPSIKEDKLKEKPSKVQDKSSKVSSELKEKSKGKEKDSDFKGMKVDKGELAEHAVSLTAASKGKEISVKAPDMPKLKEGPLKKEDKAKEKPSKEPKEDKPSTTKKEKKEDPVEAQFRKLQAERLKEKELLNKKLKQQEAEEKKARELAERKAREAAEKASAPIREAIPTPKPKPPSPPPPPPKLEPRRADEPAIEVKMNKVKVKNSSLDDLILRLVRIKQAKINRRRNMPYNLDHGKIRCHRCRHEIGSVNASSCELCLNSELEIDVDSFENQSSSKSDLEIIIGEKIFKYKSPSMLEKHETAEIVPILFQSKYEVAPVPGTPDTVLSIPVIPEPTTKPSKDAKRVELEPGKGIIRYALSDRTFIDKGWTMLPTEKVVRKMNVYRMRPAHPEFDWFEHNKNKRLMTYDTGERLAEFDDNGRGRWYYRNGRLALDYYDAEETNAQQRFVIYSSGEPDERGRSHPITILATFDYLGNGIVFDHSGKIRLKYNQTEGVVLDRGIGPVSHWKWHTLNDPPVLQQVMIDTQMAHKDPQIIKLGTAADNKIRPDNEEMLAIEFDNFIKEKSKKLSQKFKPFQIKMKALKINEHFSLKVLDQATVYLIFRDGSTNLKLNIGMILDHQEIVDTDTAEVGEVSNNLERFPARTDSLAALQRSVAYAQRYERTRTERERRLRPAEPCESADQLTAAASHPLRIPLRTVPTGSTSSAPNCRCRKPTNNLYYNTRLL